MRLNRRSVLTALLVVAALSACAGPKSRLKVGQQADGEVVEAEGFAPNNTADLIATKRASVVDAQRNAVEKAVGVFVSARTRVEKAVAIENNILARTDGYVKKYDVLEEGVTKEGLYRTKIRALVALHQLESDLRDLSLLNKPDLKRPRVLISLEEEIDKAPSKENAASAALERALTAQGFDVVTAARAADAEIEIRGNASSYPYQAEGLGGLVSYRARLSAQAARTGTHEVIESVSKEASGLGGNADLAGLKALETVGDVVGKEFATELPAAWDKGKNILVSVEGLKDFNDVEEVRKHLSSQPGVSDLVLRLYDEQTAQFEVELNGVDAAALASGLASSKETPLQVVESTGQTLRLKKP